jgi:hypothetical protein
VHESIPLVDSTDRLELVTHADGHVAVIVRVRQDGSASWRAAPPEGAADARVTVSLQGQQVVANSWSGWLVHLDAETGFETERRFTK